MGWPSLLGLGPLATGGPRRRRTRVAPDRPDEHARDPAIRQPRVLFVAPVAVEGGVAEVLLGLVRRAAAGGYEPRVVFLRDGPAASRLLATAPFVLRAGRVRRPDSVVRTIAALDAIVRRTRPDAIVAVEPSAHLYTVIPAWRHRLPVLVMYHGVPDGRHCLDRLVSWLPAAAAVMNSQFVLERSRPLIRAPLHLLHPGIDIDAATRGDGPAIRKRFGIPHESQLVGIVGRLQVWKGQDLFLEAAAIVAAGHPAAHFVVVGGANMGWEDRRYPLLLREQAQHLGIGDRVTFTGHSHEVPAWLAAMDVAVNASSYEPYGLMICEAFAAGRALVSVNQGGPLELVEHERTGLLTARDAASIAAAVSRLLADHSLRERLGASGQRFAGERMSDVRMARRFGSVLATATRPSDRSGRTRGRLRVMFLAPVSVQGGANEVLLALANPGADASYKSLVIALRPGPLLGRLVAADIAHILLQSPRLRRLISVTRTIRQLDRIIARWEPDFVFSSEAHGHLYAALPAAHHGVPAIWRQPAKPRAIDLVNRIASCLPARAVAVASHFVAAEQKRISSRPITIVRPGIAVERMRGADGPRLRRERGISPEAVLVTIVGRLQPWKGQDLFLRAAARVASSQRSTRFAVVGGAEMGWERGDFPATLQRLVRALGIEDQVLFTGQIDGVADWYAASDIVVHATSEEPFGLVICEAMLMGCAVLAADEGGPREIIDHEQTGLLVKRTVTGFADALTRLINNPQERRRLGDRARELAEREFTSARMVRDFEALLTKHASC